MDAPRLPDRQPARRRRPRRASCCPRVEAALRGARASRSGSSARTRSSTPASWRARRRAAPARSPPRWAATGSPARSPASCATATACSPCCPAGAATTSRASSASRTTRWRPCDAARAPARERRIDLAEADGRAYLGIASRRASTPTCRRSRTRRGCQARHARLHLRDAARAARAGSRRAGRSSIDGEPRAFAGYSVAVANSGVFGGGMYLAPDAELDDGLLDVVLIARPSPKRALPRAACRRCSRARTSTTRRSTLVRGARGHLPRRPPVHGLRRRRPDRRLPATVRVLPGALRVVAPR